MTQKAKGPEEAATSFQASPINPLKDFNMNKRIHTTRATRTPALKSSAPGTAATLPAAHDGQVPETAPARLSPDLAVAIHAHNALEPLRRRLEPFIDPHCASPDPLLVEAEEHLFMAALKLRESITGYEPKNLDDVMNMVAVADYWLKDGKGEYELDNERLLRSILTIARATAATPPPVDPLLEVISRYTAGVEIINHRDIDTPFEDESKAWNDLVGAPLNVLKGWTAVPTSADAAAAALRLAVWRLEDERGDPASLAMARVALAFLEGGGK